ncbi:MAG: FAD-binding oxidoreductase [Flavobacteriales bacterium]|nr:FAD-binding oxidoreductase [Flavobacteriales bacterium]
MNLIEDLTQIVGSNQVFADSETKQKYGRDMTEDFVFEPDVVVKPMSVEQVSELLKYCNQHKIVVTPRGAGTGLSGAALPINKGILLSMEHFNKILEMDEANMQVTVECGVINEVLRNAVEEKGLFYPPDPASKGSCFIGGNIAHNSGGPKAVKYGVTRDYVLNLEVVLPNGEIIWTGSNTLKNSTGYSLTHIFIGSEGTLGVVTKAVLRLVAKPKHNLLLWANVSKATTACNAVSQIMLSGVVPSGLELMERKGIDLACNQLGLSNPISTEFEASLLIEVDGDDMEKLLTDCGQIGEILSGFGITEVLFADSADQKEHWWKIRRSIGEVVKNHSVYKEEDTVVKRSHLADLMAGVKEIGVRYGFESVCYGHAGDGNLHVNILKNDLTDEQWNGRHLERGIREIFQLCKKYGGTISGEHGIGYVQKKYMNELFSETHIGLMKSIKQAFDPNGIMNPGKIF